MQPQEEIAFFSWIFPPFLCHGLKRLVFKTVFLLLGWKSWKETQQLDISPALGDMLIAHL